MADGLNIAHGYGYGEINIQNGGLEDYEKRRESNYFQELR
jgi:hypothetical protein